MHCGSRVNLDQFQRSTQDRRAVGMMELDVRTKSNDKISRSSDDTPQDEQRRMNILIHKEIEK